MKVYSNSLARTVDSVNETYFLGQASAPELREEIARWIAGRQGLPGSYADMFAPTVSELKNGITLFSGEKLPPSASVRHVSGEEACRALILLNSPSKEVKSALNRATDGMRVALDRAESMKKKFFCCGTCDPALWRHLTAGGLKGSEEWLAIGMRTLRAHRDGAGRWRRFHFYYTLLALTEIDLPAAVQEMRYAARSCERFIARRSGAGAIARRRRLIVERVLEKC